MRRGMSPQINFEDFWIQTQGTAGGFLLTKVCRPERIKILNKRRKRDEGIRTLQSATVWGV